MAQPITEAGARLPDGHTARTAELWFKTSASTPLWPTLISYGTWTASNSGLLIWLDGPSQICTDFNVNQICSSLPYRVNDGRWHYVAATYDGDLGVVNYVDGRQIGTGTLTTPLNTSLSGGRLILGGDPWAGDQLSGSLDEVAIYPSALSSATIADRWKLGNGVSCPGAPADSYGGKVAANSPTRYYRMDDASDAEVLSDSSAQCAMGAYVGDAVASYGATGAMAPGSSVSFNGARIEGAVAPETGLPDGRNARTAEFWFKTSVSNPQPTFFSYGTWATPGDGFLIWLQGTSNICTDFNGSQYQICTQSPYPLNDGRWHYVAATYDGNVGVVNYVDGQKIGTGTLASPLNTVLNGRGLILGGDPWAGDQLTGSLDEVAIYDHALSVTDILSHAAAAQLAPDYPAQTNPFFAGAYGTAFLSTWFEIWNEAHAEAVFLTGKAARNEYLGVSNVWADLYTLRDALDPGPQRALGDKALVSQSLRPDLVLQTVDGLVLYEVKSVGQVTKCPGQIANYLSVFGATAGAPLPVRSGTTPVFGLNLTVESSDVAGCELYTIDGGTQKVYDTVAQQLAARGITPEAEQQGRLTIQTASDGSFDVFLDGTRVLGETPWTDPDVEVFTG